MTIFEKLPNLQKYFLIKRSMVIIASSILKLLNVYVISPQNNFARTFVGDYYGLYFENYLSVCDLPTY